MSGLSAAGVRIVTEDVRIVSGQRQDHHQPASGTVRLLSIKSVLSAVSVRIVTENVRIVSAWCQDCQRLVSGLSPRMSGLSPRMSGLSASKSGLSATGGRPADQKFKCVGWVYDDIWRVVRTQDPLSAGFLERQVNR